ncbi:MAG TPA: prolyl oligopeptidase family serine peptidase [Acidimicrobiia bacterium]|nr:prolyl oligopeptidase family serine peptidase [Acidimicrobiia bacterium]
MVTIAPYGAWDSPIAAADTVAGQVTYRDLFVDGDSVYWTEMRPSEGGRQVLVRKEPHDAPSDLTPPPHHARTRVHEYGGGSTAASGGRVAFSEFSDQRLYTIDPDGTIAPLTPEPPRPASWRYADGRFLPDGSLVCVEEGHPEEGEATNRIVRVSPTGEVTVIATGRDFYSSPRPSPDGTRLAWLEWDHPNMPWDGTELKVGRLDSSGDITQVAGGVAESILHPCWRRDGRLFFVSDRSGWWNVYSAGEGSVTTEVEMAADIGEPAWTFGHSSFGFLSGGRLLVGYWRDGTHRLGIADSGTVTELEDPFTIHSCLRTDGRSRTWFLGAGPTSPSGVFRLDVDTGEMVTLAANPSVVPGAYIPKPRLITFPTGERAVAHGVFYPPTNPNFVAPEGELPPLIVEVHGGPTSHVYPRLAATVAFWTSRGFAVVDVNYRGSTGFGREYRNLLRDSWGIYDVEDCRAAARYLAEQGLVDGDRLIITGGSAGGYTTLAALAFGDEFRAGASYYGVADIALLNEHTHKFESRYLDGLVGTDPDEIRRRSPLFSCDRITAPVVLFQGLEDRVVPPEQAEEIAAALDANGIPYAHITYAGEDHGFRQAENLIHSLETELAFYGQVFGFRPAGDLPEVPLIRSGRA